MLYLSLSLTLTIQFRYRNGSRSCSYGCRPQLGFERRSGSIRRHGLHRVPIPSNFPFRLVNSRLDADSRGWRILAAWLLEISTWLEVMTPLFPHSFLLLATLANVGKNISWLAGSATRAGIRYGFVNAHNMGDITAKEGSQTVAITVFGTFLGIVISNLIGHGHMEYVLMSSMCISAVSLFSIYRSLRCVSLPTLNYQVGAGNRGYL